MALSVIRGLWRDERDGDSVAGEVAEREQRLEPGDAAAGDHHPGR